MKPPLPSSHLGDLLDYNEDLGMGGIPDLYFFRWYCFEIHLNSIFFLFFIYLVFTQNVLFFCCWKNNDISSLYNFSYFIYS